MPISVVLADDHPLIRDGIRSALAESDDVRVVAECSDGEEILAVLSRLNGLVDVALLDVHMPRRSGLDAARVIRERYPHVRIMMLTMAPDPQLVAEAMEVGVSGYMLKHRQAAQLLNAVRLVAGGHTIIDPELMSAVAAGLDRTEKTGVRGALTERELEILKLLASGESNQEIARKLFLSVSTVKTHITTIISKLGAVDRTSAVAEAFRRRMLE